MEKKTKKQSRAEKVLMSLVELYIKVGKPVGSSTLKEAVLEELSSATIRNYFAELEKQGLVSQAHASGGRIPTAAAYKVYAEAHLGAKATTADEKKLKGLEKYDTKQLASFLQATCDRLSQATGMAAFLSSVRFDHDFIQTIRLMTIDAKRLLCVLVTDFGQVLTEQLNVERKLSSFAIRRLEAFFESKLRGSADETMLEKQEGAFASWLFNEIMVRYIVRYSNFSDEDITRTGFSNLLAYPEFNDPVALASSLSLFENISRLRLLLSDATRGGELKALIGSDLATYACSSQSTSVLVIPYKINQTFAGSLGILGPIRMPYPHLFGLLKFFSDHLSQALTKSLYKHKITFRQPRSGSFYLEKEERTLMDETQNLYRPKLLEVKDEKDS